ncbi:MAG: beta-ketoacyl-ACP synthase II [Spirochaetales bacterium]|nr:beta-ketoacyl-ACP synthase II [Spirochaetales bacterium]
MERRIVVTGLGALNPLGNDVASTWKGIRNARSGITAIEHFDASALSCRIAGVVKDFSADDILDSKEARKHDRCSLFAMAASTQAVKDSGLKLDAIDPYKIGVIIGTGVGGLDTFTQACHDLFYKGANRLHPLTVPKLICNISAANVAIAFNAQGPCFPIVTACASGTDSIATASQIIKSGITDIMIAGGVDTPVTPVSLGGFCALKALSTSYNDVPETASRPFDKTRDGFVIAEGTGILVLEELSHAQKRGAKIYAELAGFGQTCDAYHMVAPEPSGKGAAAAIASALKHAGMQPEDIDYINAHGTSTPLNDPMETRAIKTVFGDHAYKLKISSTKSMTGHMIGGAGGVEAVLSVLALRDQFFPPTINYSEKDPECDLDYVPNKGVKGTIRAVLSNSFGFGGHNAVVAFKQYSA